MVAIADAALASAHVEKHVFMNVIPSLLYFPGRMCGNAMRKRLCRCAWPCRWSVCLTDRVSKGCCSCA